MACSKIFSFLLSVVFCAQVVAGFVPRQPIKPAFAPFEASSKPIVDKVAQIVTATTAAIATSPLIALAEEVDDYEYGAVNAPIGIAWAAGVLAVATALLPLALQGGEEAFEEMKERDAGKWGSGSTDALNKRKR